MDVYCTACKDDHEVPNMPWGKLGSPDFCPKDSTLEYDESYNDETQEVFECWYFKSRS